jgi:hypothetical protein
VHEPADYQQCVTLIESALTPDALDEVRQQGAAMSLEEATDYALGLLEEAARA